GEGAALSVVSVPPQEPAPWAHACPDHFRWRYRFPYPIHPFFSVASVVPPAFAHGVGSYGVHRYNGRLRSGHAEQPPWTSPTPPTISGNAGTRTRISSG